MKTDLRAYYSEKPSVIWFGHSSYLVHYKGFNLLVDPVLSGYASPFRFYIKAFRGADVYKPSDMPHLNVILLTHNHYDHLDIGALKSLASRTEAFIMPLGVRDDLKRIPTENKKITELNWWQSISPAPGISLTATPARHFSGRGMKRNRSLWASYVLRMGPYSIFIGGDSGYDGHFKKIGELYGPFDLAILECGQYNIMWPYIHSMPEDLVVEGRELKARLLMPVHWAKFALGIHHWDEPISRFVAAADKESVAYTTPMIGEAVVIGEAYPKSRWWEDLH